MPKPQTIPAPAKGRLLRPREVQQLVSISDAGLRALMKTPFGPPGFKRPGSPRWLFWENEVLAWLESARASQRRVEG
jgi:predicted DNA-binding transcriptional regulator AlpA